MLSLHRLSKNGKIHGIMRTNNYKKSALSASIFLKKNFMTDATLINKNKLINEDCVVSNSINGSIRVIKLNPGKDNANNYLSPRHLNLLKENLSVYDKSKIAEFIVLDSVTPGSIVSKGYNIDFIKSLSTLPDESRVSETINLLKGSYDLAMQLSKANKPIVSLLNGESNNAFNAFAALAPLRVSTEFTKWSMDHLSKGLLPDLAATTTIPRVTTLGGMNGQLGIYLLLTGDVLSGEDAYIAGITTHYIPYDAVDNALERLSELDVNHFKDKLKQETVVLNTQIVNEQAWNGSISGEVTKFLSNENKKILSKINLKSFSEVLDEFCQPVHSINRNYKFKYSLEALDVIEYAFDIVTHHNFSNQFIHKNIKNRLLEIITCEDEKAFTIKWTDAHKEFAAETLNKLNKIPEFLLQATTRMILTNSEKQSVDSALSSDQLSMSEFYSNDELINNIGKVDAVYSEDQPLLKKLKNQTVEVAETIKMTQSKQFNLNLGNINESSIKKQFLKLGPTSNLQKIEQSVYLSPYHIAKTSGEFITRDLILKRCLVQNDNVLSWKKITKSISLKPYNDVAKEVTPIVEDSIVEEATNTANEKETAESADTVKKPENLSLEDLLEKDDIDIFEQEEDTVNIYNDFFKDDK
ncbi:uncharacterized protein HGUI_03345 [Hanseniaspora guilliermondii]|uniref:3-hydroxyisobutyryl-CoA hydrolase n=1 Tax=Hanseniaspora guilliermondii TaxID=56406 RepID=A0A1L0CRG3_9ASCO|nr:uncharacterized protein HGUI_03345 [Hanseniaspora guilliermondii]